MPATQPAGPSLETYIETRFNLFQEAVKDSAAAQAGSLGASIDAAKAALEAVKVALEAAMAAADLRYQQRFDAQADALIAAFSAAKEAVSAALEAQDRAVLKAELAADKRFEALNELRQMLNDTLKILMTRTEVTQMVGAAVEKIEATGKRIDALDARMNTSTGEASGNRRTKDDLRVWLGVGITILLAALTVATFVIARLKG